MQQTYSYMKNFVMDADTVFRDLWDTLPWEKREDAPRRECWMNDPGKPYTYGRGAGERTYNPQPWHPVVKRIQSSLYYNGFKVNLDACFINGYENERHALGWHSDDSPEIDQTRPIAVISFGAPREIWFRRIPSSGNTVSSDNTVEKLLLEPGSLLMMFPGMQQTHQHRIPKHSAPCGPRISLTYRGLLV